MSVVGDLSLWYDFGLPGCRWVIVWCASRLFGFETLVVVCQCGLLLMFLVCDIWILVMWILRGLCNFCLRVIVGCIVGGSALCVLIYRVGVLFDACVGYTVIAVYTMYELLVLGDVNLVCFVACIMDACGWFV